MYSPLSLPMIYFTSFHNFLTAFLADSIIEVQKTITKTFFLQNFMYSKSHLMLLATIVITFNNLPIFNFELLSGQSNVT